LKNEKKEKTSRPKKAQNKMFSFLVYVKICLLRHIRGMCTAVSGRRKIIKHLPELYCFLLTFLSETAVHFKQTSSWEFFLYYVSWSVRENLFRSSGTRIDGCTTYHTSPTTPECTTFFSYVQSASPTGNYCTVYTDLINSDEWNESRLWSIDQHVFL